MPEQTGEERTEQATPRRRREHRERGQVARSRELNSVAVLLGGLVLLMVSAPVIYAGLTGLMRFAFGGAMLRPVTAGSARDLFASFVRRTGGFLAPLAGGLVVAALMASYGQVGFQVTPQALAPKLSRLNPLEGLKRMFSLRAVMRMCMSLLKLAVLVTVFVLAVRGRIGDFLPLAYAPASAVFATLCRTVGVVGLQCCGVLAVLAIGDYAYQRWENERSMRMTRQELREELKRQEGDPQVRARIRQVQREMARRRMMQEVPEADAVVTNPTHFAVALRYDPGTMAAPKVVAKGRGLLAERIKELARHHGVPFVEDRLLAQTLYKAVELGEAVPFALYRAVARVLSYVYQLRRRQPARYVPLAEEPALREQS